MLCSEDIKRLASQEGFDLCGVTRAQPLHEGERRFRSWLDRGCGGDLQYLYNNQELRFDPSQLIEGGRSVIVCAVNYKNQYSTSDRQAEEAKIASYALMRDYHKTIRKALKRVLKSLCAQYDGLSGRVFVDSAPLMEKNLACNAALGWVGRQSLLITPQYGSFVLLGEILIDQEVDRYDEALEGDRCGACRRCIDSCPVGAINDDRTIDTRLCIACRTIEVDGRGDLPFAGWIFGCDICQSCCPHNQTTPIFTNPDMSVIVTPPTKDQWLSMDEESFREFAKGTPLGRSNLDRIKDLL